MLALGELRAKTPVVFAKALNKTATSARKRLAEKAQATYTVKTAKFNSNMDIKRASAGHLEATIKSQGRPLNITSFKATAPKSGAKAQIIAAGSLKQLIMSNIKAFKGKNGLIWQRRSSERYPVKPLKSNSIPIMIGQEQRVYGPMRPHIEADLAKFVNAEIRKLVG